MLRTGGRHGVTTILAVQTITMGRAAKVLGLTHPMRRVARAARRFHFSRSRENSLVRKISNTFRWQRRVRFV